MLILSVRNCIAACLSLCLAPAVLFAQPTLSVLPLLQEQALSYAGAFRVPQGNLGGESKRENSLSYGGGPLVYNQAKNSLFIGGHAHEKLVMEISIPKPVIAQRIQELNTARVLQPPVDVAAGNLSKLGKDGAVIGNGGVLGGLLVFGGKLVGTSYGYFDASNASVASHFTASPNWATQGLQFSGFYQVGEYRKTGLVAGYMAHIPEEWQKQLGGPALTGQAAIAIVSRSSFGPAASVFDPGELGVTNPVPAIPLVQYPVGRATLGEYSTQKPSLYYNRSTEVKGLVFPKGTRSVLFFGRHGLGRTGQGDSCYGPGSPKLEEHGRTKESNPNVCNGVPMKADTCCYDPTDSSKGVHGYPYVYQVWAYDALDLLEVKRGNKNPWEMKPYAVWQLKFPFAIENAHILGAAYDPASQRIFISQAAADRPQVEPFPLIHVFEVVLGK